MIIDSHTHSRSSHDSNTLVSDMCEFAIKNKINTFAVTDHVDIEFYEEINPFDVVKNSFSDIEKAQDKYKGKVEILKGIEIGEGIWYPEIAKKVIENFKYDIVIGSVHGIRFGEIIEPYSTINFSNWNEITIYNYLDMYFDEVYETAKTLDIDVLAHITCPIRYISNHFNIDVDKFRPKITKILKIIIEKQIALEVNCSEINKNYNNFMPYEDIIKEYISLGGKMITTASDGHIPERMANGFEKLYSMLESNRIFYCYTYKNRKPFKYKISEEK